MHVVISERSRCLRSCDKMTEELTDMISGVNRVVGIELIIREKLWAIEFGIRNPTIPP